MHLELHTADLARARAFCATLCGWRGEPIDTVDRVSSRPDFVVSLYPGGGAARGGDKRLSRPSCR